MLLYELWAETRPHEAGIPSNRASLRRGEITPMDVLTAHHGMED